MRRGVGLALVIVFVVQALLLGVREPARAAIMPNIVVVMVDDMDVRMVDHLPRLRTLLAARGMSFSSFYAASPVCCPSRAAFLRGQYPHNTGVLMNDGPLGGEAAFRTRGNDRSTVATWLRDAGYRTALVGKYLNDYEKNPELVPPGWDRWFVYAGKGKYTHYAMSDQGVVRQYGSRKPSERQTADYQTDVLTREAVEFIKSTDSAQPLFLYLSPAAPHEPATPARRHQNAPVMIDQAPRLPSFNESDVADKPGIWREHPVLSDEAIAALDALYVKQLRSMFSVEDMIAEVTAALAATGRLANTYLLFTADNGLHHGEHRIASAKNTPFEEAIRVPLIVIGPGIPAGATTAAMTSNIDLGPTFAELAGIDPPSFVDGRSLVPFFDGSPPVAWRDAVISESLVHVNGGFTVLRTGPYAYVVWGFGDRELYDLTKDPYQLENIAATASPTVVERLEATYTALAACGGDEAATCQAVDGG